LWAANSGRRLSVSGGWLESHPVRKRPPERRRGDDLVERVAEALELLQSSVLDQHDGVAVN